MTIPHDVKTRFDRSSALDAHIARRLGAELHGVAHRIDHVEVRLSDANGPRVGDRDKIALVAVSLRPSGQVIAKASASDLYDSVSQAVSRARSAVVRQVHRRAVRRRGASGAGREGAR
jgi:ribosome-associated translation inhibitor RaiA